MSEEACAMDSLRDPIAEELNSSKQRQGKFATLVAEQSRKLATSLMSEVSYYKDQVVRQRAELENYIKAKDREVKSIREYANMDLIKGLLPVLDSIDSALLNEADSKLAGLMQGQILKILSQYGFKPIEAKGAKFDPYLHEAISVTENGEDGIIVEEVQKGYALKDDVIRTSKVIVGKR